ncbi:MAG: hypothetical protein IT379_31565 [Deltaproteobacteria bacterium]|nr:hypothetical protein [Deltaproteobacteria bacterium]
MTRRFVLLVWVLVAACSGSSRESGSGRRATRRPRQLAGATQSATAQGRCDASQPDREVSEYDTSGDDVPDVRKVFMRVGRPPAVRLVLICREADLNGDGTKDVVRYYNDEGRPLREEADRDFDGRFDVVVFFENGRIVRQEEDSNRDGSLDQRIYYENGRPLRGERDMAGRSTTSQWRPDRWEYYEDGRVVRIGEDIDGDGMVDHWDREDETRQRDREEGIESPVEEGEGEGAEPAADGGAAPARASDAGAGR